MAPSSRGLETDHAWTSVRYWYRQARFCRLDIGNLLAVGKKPAASGSSVMKNEKNYIESIKSIRFRQYGEPVRCKGVGRVDALGPGVTDLAPGELGYWLRSLDVPSLT